MKNSNSHDKTSQDILAGMLQQSVNLLQDNSFLLQIKKAKQHSEIKIYHLYTSDKSAYFQSTWNYLISHDPELQEQILDSVNLRIDSVFKDILENKTSVEQKLPLFPYDYQDQYKNNKLSLLKYQSNRLKRKINQINENIDDFSEKGQKKQNKTFNDLYSQEKKKQIQEYVKNKRREQLERKRKIEQQKIKQDELWNKKQQQIRDDQEKARKQKLSLILKIERQKHEERQRQKSIRQQRNSEYLNLKKNITQRPPLYRKIESNFSKRYDNFQEEKKQKVLSERKYLHEGIEKQKIQQHQKKYLQIKQLKQKQRRERIGVQEQQEKSRLKYHSSFELPKQESYKQKQERQKEKAKQKLTKIRQYKSLVKQKFAPKIDESKRKQLMNLIEQIELGNKRVKRVKLPNGSIVYEELKDIDGKILGMEYLEKVKQMASREKGKRKVSEEFNSQVQMKKEKNYLHELREQRIKKGEGKLGFLGKKNLTYEEKLSKVMLQSEKISAQTKQAQMKLKHGKFKTSEEILACKEEIDKNYIEIVNMKLKLIEHESDH